MSEWKEFKIGEIADVTSSKRIFLSDYVSEGIPFYRSKEIIEKHNGNEISLELFIKAEQFQSIKEKFGVPLKDDILLTSVGTIGVSYQVKENEVFYFKDGNLTWIRKFRKKVVPQYLYYWINSELGQKTIKTSLIGSSQPALTISDIKKLKLILPEPKEQYRIVSILSAYDDLIENNNRRIALLEQMVEQIYKEWFVRMRFPGYENTEFEKGVPKGWKERKLSDLLKLSYGKSLLDEKRDGGEYPVYGSSGIVGFHSKSLAKGPGIIVGRKGNVGSLFYSYTDFFVIDTAYYVESEYSFIYLLHLLKTVHFIDGDAAVPGLNREQAYSNKIFFPGEDLVEKFDSLVSPIYQQRRNLQNQVQTLKQTRDLLLPRLISGKLMVKDVKKELGKTD